MIPNQITRRAVLRGLGVSIALPLFESLMPRSFATPPLEPPMRLVFVYAPNGKDMANWTPTKEGDDIELSPTLKLLEPVRKHVTVLSGLCLRNADAGGDGPGDHARAMAAFLTGCRPHKTLGSDVCVGVSVDQAAAAVIGRTTHLPSLELGCEGGKLAGPCDGGYSCAYQTNLSWRTASSPMPKEVNPRVVFERLFGDRIRPEADAARARRERDRSSVLDFAAEDARHLADRLGGADRRKLDEYLTAVREVERRIQQSQPTTAVNGDVVTRPTGIPENYEDHARLLGDLAALAFRADLTRVVTFVLGNDGSNRSYREAGVSEGHHDVSHHGGDTAKLEKVRRINHLHVAQLLHLLDRLKGTAEGSGTLLDRCLVVYGSGIRDGDRHDHDDLPVLLTGGGVRGGRHIRQPEGTPLCNLHLWLLEKIGAKLNRFGDSTGQLRGLES